MRGDRHRRIPPSIHESNRIGGRGLEEEAGDFGGEKPLI